MWATLPSEVLWARRPPLLDVQAGSQGAADLHPLVLEGDDGAELAWLPHQIVVLVLPARQLSRSLGVQVCLPSTRQQLFAG